MNRGRLVAFVAIVAALTVVNSAQAPRKTINDVSVAALQTWVNAVRTHTPGRADPAVVTVAAFSYETRVDLNTGMSMFLSALMGWAQGADGNKAAEAIAAMGRAADRDFLKRAAVLHSDVAAYGDLFPNRRTGSTQAAQRLTEDVRFGNGSPQAIPSGDAIPPLLMGERVLLDKDGEVLGETVSTWNWPFARSLLDLLSAPRARKVFSDGRPDRATDPFVSQWYHATTAHMFAIGAYGDATAHLHHASMVLPDDALSIFDRGCYAEILGLPMHQALLTSPLSSRIPAAAKTNADAERLFRRALEIDRSLVEARVRLARLLSVRERHEEAAAELKTALGAHPAGVVAFYAHLFAGRAAQSLGQAAEATENYREAGALFPDAQSALLASSQQALRQSDVPATMAPVERLGPRSAVFTADPWWQYHLAAGRDADDLLRALWASVPR